MAQLLHIEIFCTTWPLFAVTGIDRHRRHHRRRCRRQWVSILKEAKYKTTCCHYSPWGPSRLFLKSLMIGVC